MHNISDPNLRMREFRLREQQLIRAAEGERLAAARWRQRAPYGLLRSAVRTVLAILRARVAQRAEPEGAAASTHRQQPATSGTVASLRTEPRELVASGSGASSSGGECGPHAG
jgi:hypothetical protein